jgi:hypothetical protein
VLGRGDIILIFALAATGAALIYGLNLLAEYLARWVADVWASPHGDMPHLPGELRLRSTGGDSTPKPVVHESQLTDSGSVNRRRINGRSL